MFHLITCIVERGNVGKVIAAAEKAGAEAVTFFHAKGVKKGIKKKGKVSDKEIVLVVTRSEHTPVAFEEISAAAKFRRDGKGFAHILELEKTAGLLE